MNWNSIQKHVSYDREAHTPPMSVRKINPADTNRRTDPHQVGPRQQPALGYGAEIVDLQRKRLVIRFYEGDWPAPFLNGVVC
jgi:hypothetical protein